LAGINRSAAGMASSLFGHETYFKLLLRDPKLIKQANDRCADRIIEEYTAYAKMGADGTEAWEWVTGQYISPAQFDEFVKPYLKRS